MQRFIIVRVLQGLLTLFALSLVVFVLPRATGDPAFLYLGPNATEEQYQEFRERQGLDKSLPAQYLIWVREAVSGDFGESIYFGLPVSEVIVQRLPATIKLAFAAGAFAILVGLILGVLCAIKRNKAIDWLGRIIAALGQSLPSFWVGIMLILLFAVSWGVLPSSGMDSPKHYILPVLTMSWALLAGITRLTRSSMLEVLGSDYVAFVRARGTPEFKVILKHALKNAAIPVLTFAAVLFALMLTGSVIVETVFSWPGLGRLAYISILARDYAVIQAIVLLYGAIFILVNLLADILYAWLDPRIRYQ